MISGENVGIHSVGISIVIYLHLGYFQPVNLGKYDRHGASGFVCESWDIMGA